MTEPLLTQEQVEDRMYRGGIARSERSMSEAEARGEAARNPYAQALYRDYVTPMEELLVEALEAKGATRGGAHIALLAPLDPKAVAFLAVRTTLNALLGGMESPSLRQVAGAIGKTVHLELVLAQIADLNPELYYTLANDFNRKRSKSVEHRITVFKRSAKKAGVEWAEWGMADRDRVGAFLLDRLARLGMVDLDQPPTRPNGQRIPGKLAPLGVRLSPDARAVVDRIKDIVSLTSPVYGPCVEPPRDWPGLAGGGFHTPAMRRSLPFLVKAHGIAREMLMQHGDWATVTGAANALQRTAWRVNRKVLETVWKISKYRDAGEIVTAHEREKPPAPTWLAGEADPEERSATHAAEFKHWKREMAEWYTERKLRASQYSRFYSATRAARLFEDYPELFFVYFADSRGRLYPLTYGLNPQGSDLQKALIQFAHGKPLLDDDARDWFMIHGANKWGFDKAPLADRVQWVRERHDQIMAMAKDPESHDDWTDCDNPLQFLAWAFEYAEWQRLGDDFESRIAVSLDGSCNGLQNFSAMLRDEVGGKATNLLALPEREDIYDEVARSTEVLLREMVDEPLAQEWAKHGVPRLAVKRLVMTTPYGITKRSAVTYVLEDFMRPGLAPWCPKDQHMKAAQVLVTAAWQAVGVVVVKSREAMDWLQAAARVILKKKQDESGVISWQTPSGFLATQTYFEVRSEQVRTHIHGVMRFKIVAEDDDPSSQKHANGLAPNFVHSCDAAHLHITAAGAGKLGIDALAMVHDDYGTHAADTRKLYTWLRMAFIQMYTEHDPIQEFADKFPAVPAPPEKGSLDINEVLHSEHFFS